ncbi:MAG: helix-turn-helix transcriptional regulator [Hyphomonadaceae bacterium]
MGIFFDQDWFDARLKAAGLTHASMAQAAGMTIDEIDMVFRDQRELEGPEVHAIARILSVEPSEVADRAGLSDPGAAAAAPLLRPARGVEPAGFVVTREVIGGIHERLDRLERLIEVVIQKVDRLR